MRRQPPPLPPQLLKQCCCCHCCCCYCLQTCCGGGQVACVGGAQPACAAHRQLAHAVHRDPLWLESLLGGLRHNRAQEGGTLQPRPTAGVQRACRMAGARAGAGGCSLEAVGAPSMARTPCMPGGNPPARMPLPDCCQDPSGGQPFPVQDPQPGCWDSLGRYTAKRMWPGGRRCRYPSAPEQGPRRGGLKGGVGGRSPLLFAVAWQSWLPSSKLPSSEADAQACSRHRRHAWLPETGCQSRSATPASAPPNLPTPHTHTHQVFV
jgi:hypothetical protein